MQETLIEAKMMSTNWILCSSGAHPLYLENVLRTLCLPSGEMISYRYESKYVSPEFQKFATEASKLPTAELQKHVAYLCYLDNANKRKPIEIYPIRDARIHAIVTLGTSYIIQLEVLCFIDLENFSEIKQLISSHKHGELPTWSPSDEVDTSKISMNGFLVLGTKAWPDRIFKKFDLLASSHLKAFESAATALAGANDFSDGKRIFASITSIVDVKRNEHLSLKKLQAGRHYELRAYYFMPSNVTREHISKFKIKIYSDNDDIAIFEPSELFVQARYDEIRLPFYVKDDAKDGPAYIRMDITRTEKDENLAPILKGSVKFSVHSNTIRKIIFALVIGVGLFGSQAVTLYAAGKYSGILPFFVLAFSLIAGFGAAFQFKTKI